MKPTLDDATQNLKTHWSISTIEKTVAEPPKIDSKMISTETPSSQNFDRLKEAINQKLVASSGVEETIGERRRNHTFLA